MRIRLGLEHIGVIFSITPNLPFFFKFPEPGLDLGIPFEFLLLTGTFVLYL